MTPLQRYDWDVSKNLVSFDEEQRSIVRVFENLFHEILRNQDSQTSMRGFLKRTPVKDFLSLIKELSPFKASTAAA